MKRTISALAAAAISASAAAQPIVFDIDQQNSQVSVTVTVELDGLGSYNDNDTSNIDGTITANLDDPSSPSLATLLDFDAVLLSNPSFSFSPPLSSASAVLTDGAFSYAGDLSGIGPVPVTMGAATFPATPVAAAGTVTVDYNIFLAGSGMETIDLSTVEPANADIASTFAVNASTITVTSNIPFNQSVPIDAAGIPGTVTFVGNISLVATADIPECPADLDGSGALDFGDVSTFLGLFAAGDLTVDFDMSGALDFGDVSAFLALFAAGCP